MNTKKVIFLTAVIIILGSVIVPVFAQWQNPSEGPTNCAAGDLGCKSPINVSNKDQVKQTGSIPGYTGGLSIGPLLVNGSGIITDNLGIGAVFNAINPPTAPLDVDGRIRIRGDIGCPNLLLNCPDNGEVLMATDDLGNISWVPFPSPDIFFNKGPGILFTSPTGQYNVLDLRPGGRIDVATTTIQKRISTVCPAGEAMKGVDIDGVPTCFPVVTVVSDSLWSIAIPPAMSVGDPIYRNSQVNIGSFTSAPTASALYVKGDVSSTYGVIGLTQSSSGSSAGLYGIAGVGGFGVVGESSGSGAQAAGVYGKSSAGRYGVYGLSANPISSVAGVYGTVQSAGATDSYGVQGVSSATGAGAAGVYGESTAAAGKYGVYGRSSNAGGTGVYGTGSAYGVSGLSSTASGIGVYGVGNGAAGGTGIYGTGTTYGVQGVSAGSAARGVYGQNTSSGPGVYGTSVSGDGVYGSSSSGTGVYGEGSLYGVRAKSSTIGGAAFYADEGGVGSTGLYVKAKGRGIYLDMTSSGGYSAITTIGDNLSSFGGAIQLNTAGYQFPMSCNSTSRGKLFFLRGESGIADQLSICGKNSGGTYLWQTLLTF